MKKGVIIFVVLLSIFFSFYSVSAINNYCAPSSYNWTQASSYVSSICDYGVSLSGSFSSWDTNQKKTAYCLAALSSNTYYFPNTESCSNIHSSDGISSFIINGQSCSVLAAGIGRDYHNGGCGPMNCNAGTDKFDIGDCYTSSFMLNLTCNGINSKFSWYSGSHYSFDVNTRHYSSELYNYTKSFSTYSDVCDYGIGLDDFSNGYSPCNQPSTVTFSDGVLISSTDCSDNYRKQQMTLNCIFALSNNSYEFDNTIGIPVDSSRKLSDGIGNFIINGQGCKVINAGYTYRSYYDCSTPLNTCHIPNSLSGTTIIGNVSAREYYSGFMVNMTCGNVNKRYYWMTGYAFFNDTTRFYKYPGPGAASSSFFGYNKTKLYNGVCSPNFCIPCTVPTVPAVYNPGLKNQSANLFIFNLAEPIYFLKNASILIDSKHDVTNGTIITSQGSSNTVFFTNKLRFFDFTTALPGPFSTLNMYSYQTNNNVNEEVIVFNATGMCGPGCVKSCYEDKDGDGFTSGNSVSVVKTLSCPTDYYDISYFDDLGFIDCNDNDEKIWMIMDNLGVQTGSGNYTVPNSCRARCIGWMNLWLPNAPLWDNNTQTYSLIPCNPEPPITCPVTPICNLTQKQCSGTNNGYQTCFINSTGCAQWNTTIVNCDSGLTCGGSGECRSFGINVLPNISRPLSNALASKTINFSLLTSSVVNCSLGICPAGKTCTVYGGLNCSYVHFPQNKSTNSAYNLTVFWNLTNLDLNVQNYMDSGDWNRNFSQVVNFSRYFNSFAHYSATATLVYSSGTQRVNGTSPIVYFDTTTDWSCSRTSSRAWWVNPDPLSFNVSVTGTNCALHLAESGTSCCPLDNNVCRDNGECRGSASYCSELNSSTSCNSASSIIVKNSINSVFGNYNTCSRTWYVNSDCVGYNSCGCFWNSTTKTCSVGYQPTQRCSNTNTVLGECKFTTTIEDNCNSTSNVIKVSSIATLVNYTAITDLGSFKQSFADCINYNRVYACPSTAKLPFFGFFEALVALLVIFGIYIVKKHL